MDLKRGHRQLHPSHVHPVDLLQSGEIIEKKRRGMRKGVAQLKTKAITMFLLLQETLDMTQNKIVYVRFRECVSRWSCPLYLIQEQGTFLL